ncbi:MAG: phosphodiester glycosidase family protein [Acholeplasmataceae bacterium]|nr:phosphodiester glycosidase family protein [Acholeplasmataceae bacterium]
MKKIIALLLLLFTLSFVQFQEVSAAFRLYETTKQTVFVEGVRHTKIVGSIDMDGLVTNQVINYIGANPKLYSDINLVVADNFQAHGWGMSGLPIIIDKVHQRYENFRVIAGVNGDFYDINDTGQPLSLHVRDFEVIQRGYGGNRNAVGFKDNGDVVHGIPTFDGYELLVYNDEGQLKKRVPINRINQVPQSNSEVSVFFDDSLVAIPESFNKVIMSGIETKINKNKSGYFGKGSLVETTSNAVTIQNNHFIIVGHEFNNDQLISGNDYAVVQLGLGGIWDDVRFAIGSDAQALVINGQANLSLNAGASWDFPAPRTAIGIKTDGTVFFVVVDGRNKPEGMDGVKLRELGEIMAHFGADRAYNLDGGGSSTMALKDLDTEQYVILNTPSDLRIRSVANGVFFVKGEHKETPAPIPAWPDTRSQLSMPGNVFVDGSGILHFNGIEGAISYSVLVDGKETIVNDNQLSLALPIGSHEISIRAKGGALYKSSDYTANIIYNVYPQDINKFLELLRSFASQNVTP